MGVDCTAFERVELVRVCDHTELSTADWDYLYEHDQRYLGNLPEFVERGDGLPDGIYQISGDSLSIHRSYGGYNAFRERLCWSVLGVSPRDVWNDPDAYAHRSFFSIINFSDCEGFLGPRTCRRLALDTLALPYSPKLDDWDDWPTWIAMFKLAADTGVITYT